MSVPFWFKCYIRSLSNQERKEALYYTSELISNEEKSQVPSKLIKHDQQDLRRSPASLAQERRFCTSRPVPKQIPFILARDQIEPRRGSPLDEAKARFNNAFPAMNLDPLPPISMEEELEEAEESKELSQVVGESTEV